VELNVYKSIRCIWHEFLGVMPGFSATLVAYFRFENGVSAGKQIEIWRDYVCVHTK